MAGHASRSDSDAVPRHGERLRDEDEHVRGDRRYGESHGHHRIQGDRGQRVRTRRRFLLEHREYRYPSALPYRTVRQILPTATLRVSQSNPNSDGQFVWDTTKQGYLLSSFFYGYVITQIPFGILAKRYGSKYFLGVGMLINSVFGLLVPMSARADYYWLMVVRFIQGLGEVSNLIASFQPRLPLCIIRIRVYR